MNKLYILYDSRGSEEGLEACTAFSKKEIKLDSQDYPDDYKWYSYDIIKDRKLVNENYIGTCKNFTKDKE